MARRLTSNGYANPIGSPGDATFGSSVDQLMTTPGAIQTTPNPLLVRNDARTAARNAARARVNADAAARQAQLDAAARGRAANIVNGTGGFGLGLGMTKAQRDAARAAFQAGDAKRAWDLMSWNKPGVAAGLVKGSGDRTRTLRALFPGPNGPAAPLNTNVAPNPAGPGGAVAPVSGGIAPPTDPRQSIRTNPNLNIPGAPVRPRRGRR